VTDNNKHISHVFYVATGSCRPFQRSAQMQHKYELHTRELFVSVLLLLTNLRRQSIRYSVSRWYNYNRCL